mgnify:CR=1 FL=1
MRRRRARCAFARARASRSPTPTLARPRSRSVSLTLSRAPTPILGARLGRLAHALGGRVPFHLRPAARGGGGGGVGRGAAADPALAPEFDHPAPPRATADGDDAVAAAVATAATAGEVDRPLLAAALPWATAAGLHRSLDDAAGERGVVVPPSAWRSRWRGHAPGACRVGRGRRVVPATHRGSRRRCSPATRPGSGLAAPALGSNHASSAGRRGGRLDAKRRGARRRGGGTRRGGGRGAHAAREPKGGVAK